MARTGEIVTLGVRRGRFSGVAFLLALVALVLAAAFPKGYMPTLGQDGVSVVICTDNGIVEVQLDADGNPVEDHETSSERCVWGAVAKAFVAPTASANPGIAEPVVGPTPVRYADFRLPRNNASRFGARAPPAIL